jgi:hypothetical protein
LGGGIGGPSRMVERVMKNAKPFKNPVGVQFFTLKL